MHVIQWDVSSADPWKGQTAKSMVKHVMRRVRPGSIVLFHANGRGWNTGSAIPELVTRLRAKGFKFVTVSRLINTPGAKLVVKKECYDSAPGDTRKYDRLSRKLDKDYERFYKRFATIKPVREPTSKVRPSASPRPLSKWSPTLRRTAPVTKKPTPQD